jgi:hypothetical protein
MNEFSIGLVGGIICTSIGIYIGLKEGFTKGTKEKRIYKFQCGSILGGHFHEAIITDHLNSQNITVYTNGIKIWSKRQSAL